jgi:hypothetical protein
MRRHFKRPKSKLAARVKEELWAGRQGTPKPALPEPRHKWMASPADPGFLKRGEQRATDRARTRSRLKTSVSKSAEVEELPPPESTPSRTEGGEGMTRPVIGAAYRHDGGQR